MSSAFRNAFVRAALVAGGALYLLTGAIMLVAPGWFYDNIGSFPPFNRHYIGDLGSFLLPLGAALLLAARNPAAHRGLAAFAAVASLLHAANHTVDDIAARVSLITWVLNTLPLFAVAAMLGAAYVLAGGRRHQKRQPVG